MPSGPGARTRLAYGFTKARASLEMIGVHRGEVLPLLGKIVFGKDRLNGTGRLTRTAIYALIGVDIQHLSTLKLGFILARVYAIHRTNIHASRILRPYAGFSDYICHLKPVASFRT